MNIHDQRVKDEQLTFEELEWGTVFEMLGNVPIHGFFMKVASITDEDGHEINAIHLGDSIPVHVRHEQLVMPVKADLIIRDTKEEENDTDRKGCD